MMLDLEGDSGTLLIAAGGLLGELSMPPFEFFRVAQGLPCKRIFMRDLHQAWYHRGLPGYGGDLDSVVDALRSIIAGAGVDRLVFAGSSAGGYAALLFGAQLGAQTVLCFGGQTVIEPAVLARFGDHRWDAQLLPLAEAGKLDTAWTDLRQALPGVRCADTRLELYYDRSVSADRQHAEWLRDIDGVRLFPFNSGGHAIARAMRETGALHVVLARALGVTGAHSGR